MHRCTGPPSGQLAPVQTLALKVLPTMSVRTLRLKLAKAFRLARSEQAAVRLWLRMPQNAYAELEADDGRDLSWWGLEDGSEVVLASQ